MPPLPVSSPRRGLGVCWSAQTVALAEGRSACRAQPGSSGRHPGPLGQMMVLKKGNVDVAESAEEMYAKLFRSSRPPAFLKNLI